MIRQELTNEITSKLGLLELSLDIRSLSSNKIGVLHYTPTAFGTRNELQWVEVSITKHNQMPNDFDTSKIRVDNVMECIYYQGFFPDYTVVNWKQSYPSITRDIASAIVDMMGEKYKSCALIDARANVVKFVHYPNNLKDKITCYSIKITNKKNAIWSE